MKCAKEIKTIKEQTVTEHENNLNTRAINHHINACIKAIEFCENVIGPEFEKKAKDPDSSNFLFLNNVEFETDRFGNIHFHTMKRKYYYRTVHHRNGSTSEKCEYRYVQDSADMDKETFINYLAKHCYTCKCYNSYIGISLDPQC